MTPAKVQQSSERTPTSSRNKGKRFVFPAEKEELQTNENFDFVSHKEEIPKMNKKQLNDKGKGPMNAPKEDHDKMLIESLQKQSEEYRSLNDDLMEKLKSLKEENRNTTKNKK